MKVGILRMVGIGVWIVGCWIAGVAQPTGQTVRGTVSDIVTGKPIADARVTLSAEGVELAGQTDAAGEFRLTPVPAARYVLTISAQGFATYTDPGLVVISGKETVADITLDAQVFEAGAVEIAARINRDPGPVSTRVFTVEETQRYAAVYFDPARMATSYPGVVQAHDQANHLIIRGNSPNSVQWRLEGVDIVNPNHLTNAGTFSDRLSQSGGGTILLSSQLMTNSSLSTGAFAAQYGNALSGVFDINLRRGNNEQYEGTAQASLIGIDLSAEGPLSAKHSSSFLVNYRYSFTGLLGLMGITFGGETIKFQDLAFNLSFPTAKAGTFTVFGMGGLSSNVFQAPDSQPETAKDRYDISFFSNMGAGGITHRLLLGERTLIRSSLVVSGIDSERQGDFIQDNGTRETAEYDRLTQGRISLTTSVTTRLSARASLTAGAYLTRSATTTRIELRPLTPDGELKLLADHTGSSWLLQPYTTLLFKPVPRLDLQAGLHAMYFFLNGSRSLEPRLSATWRPAARHDLRLSYGNHSQLQLPGTYFSVFTQPGGTAYQPNRDLDFTRAHHLVLSYNFHLNETLHLRAEPYAQWLYGVPVSQTHGTYSALNQIEGFVSDSLVNEGSGRNYGLELSVEKYLSRQYYLLFSSALYESAYQGSDQVWRDTRFNGRYALSLTAGREFSSTTRRQNNRTLGVNLRVIYAGGMWTMPVDTAASRAARITVYDETQGFAETLPAYFRTDLRVTFKLNKPKYTRTLGIDIQNVTNQLNVAFRAWDFVQDQVVTRYQLGLIPLLNYRIEF
ncbi:MAG: TonB-dependent receptor [Bacteroidia bacterium]|nr:TonB-dependent receptor [Bacteroidia bacterium]